MKSTLSHENLIDNNIWPHKFHLLKSVWHTTLTWSSNEVVKEGSLVNMTVVLENTVFLNGTWCATLKVDMPILTCIFFTFNWLTLTSEMHFSNFHPEVTSCLLSRGKRKYAFLGMRLLWKYIRNYFLVYHLISHFLLYLQNYKEFEAEILDFQSEKYGLSFDIKKYTTSGWALGEENVIGIRAFKLMLQCRLLVSATRKKKKPFYAGLLSPGWT